MMEPAPGRLFRREQLSILWRDPYTPTYEAGVENIQIRANNTGAGSNFKIQECDECWLSGVEGNYTDGDQFEMEHSYKSEVINSYFSNSFLHTLRGHLTRMELCHTGSTLCLVQNNIFERLCMFLYDAW